MDDDRRTISVEAPEANQQPVTSDVALDSTALSRILNEVRNDVPSNPSAYNRTYNRHNR